MPSLAYALGHEKLWNSPTLHLLDEQSQCRLTGEILRGNVVGQVADLARQLSRWPHDRVDGTSYLLYRVRRPTCAVVSQPEEEAKAGKQIPSKPWPSAVIKACDNAPLTWALETYITAGLPQIFEARVTASFP
ncbi:hypothetical protein HJFPF1_07755 [Paramyrothecium foliicola]|nr:hypothetical protein HJFPF1_07755 [Paramyrothecium foliicola]